MSSAKALVSGLVSELPAVIDDGRWSVLDFLPRQREGWHPPAVTVDRVVKPLDEGTMGTGVVRCRLVAVASDQDTENLPDQLYDWTDDGASGRIGRLKAITHSAWSGTPRVLGVEINDDLKIGPQTYRAAIVSLEFMTT